MNTPDTEDTSNTRKVHVNTLPVNTPDTEWREELEGRLFAYLGAMNMLGVMEGKTTDGTIVQRDKAVDDILQIVQSLLTSRDTYWKERVRKEIDICEDVLKGSAGSKSEIEGAFWHLRNNLLTK